MLLPAIQLFVPDRLVQKFKAKAKAIFPLEQYAVVLGHTVAGVIQLTEFVYPEFKSTDSQIFLQPVVLAEIAEYAKEHDLRVYGDIHSHCYEEEYSIAGYKMDRARSEADHYYAPLFTIQGICVITKHNDKMKASVKWWGPTIPVQLAQLR
jgi:hypothetical protein